jgi:hypothetical protein
MLIHIRDRDRDLRGHVSVRHGQIQNKNNDSGFRDSGFGRKRLERRLATSTTSRRISLNFVLYHLMGYTLETISDKGDDEEDENGRVDAAVRTVLVSRLTTLSTQ